MPKVSIIIPSYNHAKYLRESIESVLCQSYTDFELIIYDDCSSDESWSIIEGYSDARIKKFRNSINVGANYSVNTAIFDICVGEYIAIQNSDDVWRSDKLQIQVDFLEAHQNYGAVFSNAEIINEIGEPLDCDGHQYLTIFNQQNRNRHEWLRYFFEKGNALCHPSVLVRKHCYVECGAYRGALAQLPDFDMWIRLALRHQIYILSEKLLQFRVRDNEANASGNTPEKRGRSVFEYSLILDNYLQINSVDDLVQIFPEAEKYCEKDEPNIRYALAMAILEIKPYTFAVLFALKILFFILNDPVQKSKLNFTDADFSTLTGELDPLQVKMVDRLNGLLKARDEQIGDLNKILSDGDLQVAGLSQQLVDRDEIISKLNNEMAKLIGKIDSMKASKCIRFADWMGAFFAHAKDNT